jgi:hypothetical protein
LSFSTEPDRARGNCIGATPEGRVRFWRSVHRQWLGRRRCRGRCGAPLAILSGDPASRPLSVVMAALARNIDVSWSPLNAAIFIAILPTLGLVVIVWRYIVEELLSGAVKG